MGMFDDVSIYMKCPRCHEFGMFALQTKDLECALFHYYPLVEDWFTNENEGMGGAKKFRSKLPVFPQVPYDKSADAWESQAERSEILAMPTKEITEQLKYILVYGSCLKCKCSIEGKLKIEKGFLIQPLFDIVLNEKRPYQD